MMLTRQQFTQMLRNMRELIDSDLITLDDSNARDALDTLIAYIPDNMHDDDFSPDAPILLEPTD